MPINKVLVRQKLKRIIADVELIRKGIGQYAYEELISNEEAMTTVERRLERLINRSLDINLHLIRALNIAPPDDYQSSFIILGTQKILDPALARAIAPCVGTRNVLVHEYDDLNNVQFYEALQNAVQLFPQYVQAIEHHLETVAA